MEIFSLATWRPALSAICGEGKGLKELDTSIIKPLSFSEELGPVFFLDFNQGLFSFLFLSIPDTQNQHKRKLGVNKSQDARVLKQKGEKRHEMNDLGCFTAKNVTG